MSFPDYTSLPQYANILHLWKLDEESGTRSDTITSSGNLADGNTVLYGTGKISNAANFELDNAESLSATISDLNFTSGNFSVSFWVKPESLPSGDTLMICRGRGSVDGWYIGYYQNSDDLYYRLNTSGANTNVHANTSVLSVGNFIHITIVRNGTTGYIYINGADQTSASDTLVNAATSTKTFYVGRYDDALYYLDGLVDELIIWNLALSSAEVSTLYNWYSKVGLSGAITFVGAVNIKPFKLLEGAITFVGILQKLPKKLLTGAISFTGTLSSIKNKIDDVWKFIVKRTTTWTRERTDIYSFDFSFDDGNWTLSDATISSGVLDITADEGYGNREPDAGWLSGANDDFELEVDFKQDSTVSYGAEITLMLAGDVKWIYFDIQGSANLMEIWYNGTKASQSFVDDTNWHTMKVRRVGTTYYMSIDGGDEISWDYGTARTLEDIKLSMYDCTGDFDNFKYYGLEVASWTAQDKETTTWTEQD